MTLLEEVKICLRVRSNTFDEAEILPILNAFEEDLKLAGVGQVNLEDPLIRRAAVLYAKAQFGWNDDGERWQRAYDSLKISLALAGDYQ